MKSTHRTQAKAKRSQRTHYVMTYGLLDTLFASPDAPMPAEKRRHQLTRMYGGLRALETAPAPTRDDWRVVSDAVNLMETLVKDMRLCEDSSGLLDDAVKALAIAEHATLKPAQPSAWTAPASMPCARCWRTTPPCWKR
jgi:hypothetical protein